MVIKRNKNELEVATRTNFTNKKELNRNTKRFISLSYVPEGMRLPTELRVKDLEENSFNIKPYLSVQQAQMIINLMIKGNNYTNEELEFLKIIKKYKNFRRQIQFYYKNSEVKGVDDLFNIRIEDYHFYRTGKELEEFSDEYYEKFLTDVFDFMLADTVNYIGGIAQFGTSFIKGPGNIELNSTLKNKGKISSMVLLLSKHALKDRMLQRHTDNFIVSSVFFSFFQNIIGSRNQFLLNSLKPNDSISLSSKNHSATLILGVKEINKKQVVFNLITVLNKYEINKLKVKYKFDVE